MPFIEDLCEGSSSWGPALSSLTLTGLQPCFEDLVLLGAVYVGALACLAMRAYSLAVPPVPAPAWRRSTLARLALLLIEIVVPLVLLGLVLQDGSPAPYELIILPLRALAFILITAVWLRERTHPTPQSPYRHTLRFLLLWAFAGDLVRFQSQRALKDISGRRFTWGCFLAGFVPLLLLVLQQHFVSLDETRHDGGQASRPAARDALESKLEGLDDSGKTPSADHAATDTADHDDDDDEVDTHAACVEQKASFVNRIFFNFMTPLIKLGHRRPLQQTDVWPLAPDFEAEPLAQHFDRLWAAEMALKKDKTDIEVSEEAALRASLSRLARSESVASMSGRESSDGDSNGDGESAYAKGDKRPSLLRALRIMHGRSLLSAAPFMLLQNLFGFVPPILIGYIVEFVDSDEPAWKGYCYCVAFFVAPLLLTLCENTYFDIVIKTGVRVRSTLVTAIFRKAMRVESVNGAAGAGSAGGKTGGRQGSGAIVNHMATDTDKIAFQVQMCHNLWSAPVRLLIGLGILISSLGGAGVIGFICVVVLIPVQKRAMVRTAALSRKVMALADERVRLVTELIGGMRVVKYYNWEPPFLAKLRAVREKELAKLHRAGTSRAITGFLTSINPVALSVGTFVSYGLLEGNLSAADAFKATALFQLMLWPLMLLPRTISSVLVDGKVAVERIERFLLEPETKESRDDSDADAPAAASDDPHIRVRGAFTWGAPGCATSGAVNGDKPILSGVDLDVRAGQLVAVIGATGSGKSSLLSAMLGEMTPCIGCDAACAAPLTKRGGSLAYVAQTAWIYNATVRENICFGAPFDRARFERAVAVSGLATDISQQFPQNDLTEIGEKGVNLSGGQKQRISIARAVYANTQVVLFDDPLSALDAHVGAQVFRECICGALGGKLRVLVMNQVHLCKDCDLIVVLKDGKVVEQGTHDELTAHGAQGEYAHLLEEAGVHEDANASDAPGTDASADPDDKASAVAAGDASAGDVSGQAASAVADKQKEKDGKLVQREKKAEGGLKWRVVVAFVRAVGGAYYAAVFTALIVAAACNMLSYITLAAWAESDASQSPAQGQQQRRRGDSNFAAYNEALAGLGAPAFVGLFAAFAVGEIACSFIAQLVGYKGSIKASRVLHGRMCDAVAAAPMAFFDANPTGRILNRFTADVNKIDTEMQFMLQMLLSRCVQFGSTLAMMGIAVPYSLVPFVPLAALFLFVQQFYRRTSVDLKRLDAVARSPIYSHFSEALAGMPTIRAYHAQGRMSASNAARVDREQRVYLVSMQCNRWLSVRLETLGALLVTSAGVFAVLLRSSLTGAVVGLLLSYSSVITTQLNMIVRFYTMTEASFNAVERIEEYSNVESERRLAAPNPPPEGWPSAGVVEFRDVVLRYRKDMPPTLKGLSLRIGAREKVGVVGRTGAGKSTLFQALFRIVEVDAGSVEIDGLDVAAFELGDLRRAIAIIPQEPVLFSGTLRFNLDPFSEASDADVWSALERASLARLVRGSGQQLEMRVAEGGENFSVGQRQLICLARALLRTTKILVLDEATASVDPETDALIQQTIRTQFADRTTLTIAHRLNTIIDSDRVLVLDQGRVREFDTPANLLADADSDFSAMVAETGAENAAFLRAAAAGEVRAEELVARPTLQSTMSNSGRDSDGNAAGAGAGSAADMVGAGAEGYGQLSRGTLMVAVDNAADTLAAAFLERHAAVWEEERRAHGVSDDVWVAHLASLLDRINVAGRAALEEDGFDAEAYAESAAAKDTMAEVWYTG